MNITMYIQIILSIIIIIIVTANPATSGSGLDGLMGSSADKKSKSGRIRKHDKIFFFIIFIFFSASLSFSIFSQKQSAAVEPIKIEKLIPEGVKDV